MRDLFPPIISFDWPTALCVYCLFKKINVQTVPILSKDEAELCRCGGAGSNQREMEGVGGRAQNRGAWSTAVKEICAESLGKGGGCYMQSPLSLRVWRCELGN